MSEEKILNHISRQYQTGVDDLNVVYLRKKNGLLGADTWRLALIISLLFNIGAGLMLIWISIDRTDIGYEIHKTQKKLDSGIGHTVKLEVERDTLLSPYVLDKKALELGLKVPIHGQVRRIFDTETPETQDNF